MDYEQKMIDGVEMVAFQGCWYPLYEDEPDYDEKVEDGMVMILVNGHWYPVAEAVQDMFPFYDLTNEDLQELYEDDFDLQTVFDPLEYEDEDEVYDMLLIE
jgi:hypothetical protein